MQEKTLYTATELSLALETLFKLNVVWPVIYLLFALPLDWLQFKMPIIFLNSFLYFSQDIP